MFKGTTDECFQDLTNKIQETQPRRALSSVLQIDYAATFCLWLKLGRVTAKGENMIRLRIALELLGYQVTEWSGLSTLLHYVAEALAYQVQTLDQVREGLNYKATQDVYRVLLRGTSMYPDRETGARRYVASIEGQVVQARMVFHTRLQMADPEIAALLVPMSKPTNQEAFLVPRAMLVNAEELTAMFAGNVAAMLPLARYFDSLSAEDRSNLRKEVGYDDISELSLLLRNLTSEKTRQNLAESKKGGRIR